MCRSMLVVESRVEQLMASGYAHSVPSDSIFVPNGYKVNFREQQHTRRYMQWMGRAPYFTTLRKPVKGPPRVKQSSPGNAAQGQNVNPGVVLSVLGHWGCQENCLRRSEGGPKVPEKKKERALANIRDKPDKERKIWKGLPLMLRKTVKRLRIQRMTAFELEVELARATAMAPTPVSSSQQTDVAIEEVPFER